MGDSRAGCLRLHGLGVCIQQVFDLARLLADRIEGAGVIGRLGFHCIAVTAKVLAGPAAAQIVAGCASNLSHCIKLPGYRLLM
jgi:hypothetical protein